MGIVKEFKEFAVKGNMLDMAVGIIIGGAFGKIITSLVNDVLMPPLGLLLGKVDFGNLKAVLQKDRMPLWTVRQSYNLLLAKCQSNTECSLTILLTF